MPSSHILVLISIFSALFLGLLILIYQYVYPKKKITLFCLLLLISCLPLISIFRPGTYESGDLSIHIREAITFYQLLGQGELFPIWGGDMNAGYGYPAFLFTYPLPFYLMALIHFIGFSFTNSAKVLLAASFITSGIFMYLWLKQKVGEKGAFVGGLFYLFAPYHLIDLHFRSDIGEILAFVFLPLCLFTAEKFIKTRKAKWFFLEIISFAGLILSHPAIALAGVPLLLLYIFVLVIKQKRINYHLLIQFIILVCSIFVTAFYWLPLLLQQRFTHHLMYASQSLSFVKFSELFYSPYRFGLLFQGSYGELAHLLGYAQLLVIVLALIFLFKKKIKQHKQLLIVSLLIVFVASIMMLEISKPIWIYAPFIKNFQFTYRLLGIVIFASAVIAAIVTAKIKKKWFLVFICFFVIFSTLLNWGNRKNLPEVTDNVLKSQIPFNALNGGGLIQGITVWSDPKEPWAKNIASEPIKILQGKGKIAQAYRTNVTHVYAVDAKTPLHIQENTLYFPGWKVFIDDKEQKTNILSSSSPSGLFSFNIPEGKHIIVVKFEDTIVVKIGKFISVIALVLSIFLTLLIFKKRI